MSKTRNFCFTINNYTEDSHKALWDWNQVTYIIYGREVGEQGTPHLQGYCELKTAVVFTTIKKKIPTAHIENRQGTAAQAAEYCKKEKDFVEKGEMSNQGKRTDIEQATDLIIAGKTMREVALNNPSTYVKFHKGLMAFKSIILQPRDSVPEVICYYGTTGVGKSKIAREETDKDTRYVWNPSNDKWFDGYEGQPQLIMEEFRGQLPFGFILALTDRYDMKVQYKGGMIEMVATKIIFTSPKHPREWYNHETDSTDKIDQLLRRFTKIEQLEKRV